MYDFRNNNLQRTIALETAVYQRMLDLHDQLMSAYTEGVFEVTVRSQHQTVTIPVSFLIGGTIAAEAADFFMRHIALVERNLNASLEEQSYGEQRQATISSLEAQAAAVEASRAEVAQPPARKVGRPRKSIMEAVGQAAAEVPMNGSTAHAVGRAVGQPTA